MHKQIPIKFKKKVLEDFGDIFNELYYIYKCNAEKDVLNTKKKKIGYKKLRLADDYQYESEEEEQQQTSKKIDKKEPLKKPTKDDLKEFNELIKEKKQT